MKKIKKISIIALLGATFITLAGCAVNEKIESVNSKTISTEVSSNNTPSSVSGTSSSNIASSNSKAASSSRAASSTNIASSNSIAASSSRAASSTNISSNNVISSTDSIPETGISSITNQCINITDASGYTEGAYLLFDAVSGDMASDYTVTYKKNGSSVEKVIDTEGINISGTSGRTDILGLSAGTYTIKIAKSGASASAVLNVNSADRSGYAHFNNSGVGAYNDDGTLKSNADVIYVSNATKNTVEANINGTTYTGLTNILKNLSKSSNPVSVRLLDTIETTQFNAITYESAPNTSELLEEQAASLGGNYSGYKAADIISNGWNSYSDDLAKGITQLSGLSSSCSYSSGEFDSSWNMLSIGSAKNVTLEGVGTNAGLYQWGITWSKCDNIEVKNLTFSDYTEDACSFESGSVTANGYYWIHNNTFNRGKNNWDLSFEQDKPAGDGATDFKKCHNITSSYNQFNHCKKTGLIGGGNSQLTMNVTFHHNYYNEVGSRLPLGRQANMHIYNNYYYNCTTCQDIRANAFVLSEANYFDSCDNPQIVRIDDTYTGTVIKSYGDYLINCGASAATVVTSRTQTLSGACKPDGSTDYTNFDIDSSKFYYDNDKNISNVQILHNALDVPEYVINYAGANNYTKYNKLLYSNIADSSFDNVENNENNNEENENENPTSIFRKPLESSF